MVRDNKLILLSSLRQHSSKLIAQPGLALMLVDYRLLTLIGYYDDVSFHDL
jgi:hypothetical protein